MKVTIKYEECEDAELHMTLRLTLPQKYVNGPTKDIVKLFTDHYNKKHAASPLDPAILHVKIVGGDHLDRDLKVADTIRNGDECYLMGEEARLRPTATPAAAPPTPATGSSNAGYGSKTAAKADEQGRLRCKRFGCQKFYDPNGEPQECVHHKAAPIFHETAKWWSCCSDRKAYDWEEFMRIPGCQKGFCSATPEGQAGGKRFLGGCDLRGDNAPQRLDADAPKDPRQRLVALRRGLVAIGVDAELFEKVWSKLAAETPDDVDKVCDKFRQRFASLLNRAD